MVPVNESSSSILLSSTYPLVAFLLLFNFDVGDLIRWLDGVYIHEHTPLCLLLKPSRLYAVAHTVRITPPTTTTTIYTCWNTILPRPYPTRIPVRTFPTVTFTTTTSTSVRTITRSWLRLRPGSPSISFPFPHSRSSGLFMTFTCCSLI